MCKAIKNLFSVKRPSEETMASVDKEEENVTEEPTTEAPVEKEGWVWVDGFKGMDKNMQCHNSFQYELGKRYDMEEGAEIEACRGGFHLCLKLTDVFKYVSIGDDNRFFRVRALVRKSDADEYGKVHNVYGTYNLILHLYIVDKLAAKSIEIIRELTADEILKSYGGYEWDEKYKQLALSMSVDAATNAMQVDDLTGLGYSLPFAQWLVINKKYKVAKAVGSQTDLSMDMKCLMIMNG